MCALCHVLQIANVQSLRIVPELPLVNLLRVVLAKHGLVPACCRCFDRRQRTAAVKASEKLALAAH